MGYVHEASEIYSENEERVVSLRTQCLVKKINYFTTTSTPTKATLLYAELNSLHAELKIIGSQKLFREFLFHTLCQKSLVPSFISFGSFSI